MGMMVETRVITRVMMVMIVIMIVIAGIIIIISDWPRSGSKRQDR